MISGSGRVLGTGSPVLSDNTSSTPFSSCQTPPTPFSPDMPASPLNDIPLKDIRDRQLRRKVIALRERFPSKTVLFLRNCLLTCRSNMGYCQELLRYGKLPGEIKSNVSQLLAWYPGIKEPRALDVLIARKGNLEEAASHLKGEIAGTLKKPINYLSQLNTIPNGSSSNTTERYPRGILPTMTISTKTHKPSTVNANKPVSKVESTPQDSYNLFEREMAGLFKSQLPSPAPSTSPTSPTSHDTEAEKHRENIIIIEEDNIEEKVTLLYESCLRNIPHEGCRKALQNCDENLVAAHEMLSLEHGIFEKDGIEAYGKKCDSEIKAGKRPETSTPTPKRCLESPEQSSCKRARITRTQEKECGFDSDSGEDEEGYSSLGPAKNWLTTTYPDQSTVVVILGRDKVSRDNVPMGVLYENFKLMKRRIEATPSVGPSQQRIVVPEVNSESFDLAVQFVICGNITLECSSAEAKNSRGAEITAILALVDSAIKLGLYNLADLVDKMASNLKEILCRDYLVLTGSHIRCAYSLRESEPIQRIFVKATVRRFMEYNEDDNLVDDFNDDDEEDMNAAQQAAYSGGGFVFQPEFKRIPQFQAAVWDQVHRVMSSRHRVTKRPQRGKNLAIIVAYYTDPLTKKRFTL